MQLEELIEGKIDNQHFFNLTKEESYYFFKINKKSDAYYHEIINNNVTHIYFYNLHLEFNRNHLKKLTLNCSTEGKYYVSIPNVSEYEIENITQAKLNLFILILNEQKIFWEVDDLTSSNTDYLILKVGKSQFYFYLWTGSLVKITVNSDSPNM
jgi:hypothetical protein